MRERKWLVVLFCIAAIALTLACSDKEVTESNSCFIDYLSVPGSGEIGEPVPISFYLSSMVYSGPVIVTISGTPNEPENTRIGCTAQGKIESTGTDISCAITFKTPGNKKVTVSVDQGAICRTSSTRDIMINPEAIALTSLSIGSDRTSDIDIKEGDTVKLSGWVQGKRKDNAPITGSIVFNSGNSACTAQIVGGKGECSLTLNGAGNVEIHAAYSGDELYLPSTSSVYWIVKAQSKIEAVVSPNPAYTNSPVTVDFTVLKSSGSASLIPKGEVLITTSEFRPDDTPFYVNLTDGSGSIIIQFNKPDANAYFELYYMGDSVFEYSETTINVKIVAYQAQTGCWVYSFHGSQCVSPCPNPAEYPSTCTP